MAQLNVPQFAGRHSRSPSISSHVTKSSGKSVRSFRSFVKALTPVIRTQIDMKRKKDPRGEKAGALVDRDEALSKSTHVESFDDTDAQDTVYLEEHMDIHTLEELMFRFKNHVPYISNQRDRRRVIALAKRKSAEWLKHNSFGLMTMEEFRDSLYYILEVESWDERNGKLFDKQMKALFKKVDFSSDGLVDWDKFCTYILLRYQENDVYRSLRNPITPRPNFYRIDYTKETTTKILIDYNPTRYVAVGKDGNMGVWSTDLELIRTIEMAESSEMERTSNKRHFRMWITDAVTMENANKMVLSATNRNIFFYDMSTPVYTAQIQLTAIGSVPLCLNYHYDPKNKGGTSMLLIGCDSGAVHILNFLHPVKGLFETPFKNTSRSQLVYFQDLCLHSRFVTHLVLPNVHSDWVRRVCYVPSSDFIISCSGSSNDSLVVRDIGEKKRKTYVFKVSKGIECFDFSKEWNVIATGGVDHAVRLWNPYVTVKPVAIMKGHMASVIDLTIQDSKGHVYSYDKDSVLKIWDVKEHICLQTVAIKFPFGHSAEYGPFPLHLVPQPHNCLLIASDDSLVELKLASSNDNKNMKTTHARPLCAALYNPDLNQVITSCEGSVVTMWDLETGKRVLQFSEAHGTEEITAMALAIQGKRLFTGARNGSIHVWNTSNGHLLYKLEPYDEAEVTGIEILVEKRQVLSVGWHKKIIKYQIDLDLYSFPPDDNWKGGQGHQDDILTMAFCSPSLLATGSYDGDLILWNTETERIFKRLKKGGGSIFKSKILKVGMVNARGRSLGKSMKFPIDKILFLSARRDLENVLVSSQLGNLEFWNPFGTSYPIGSFYAGGEGDCGVLALATDPDNRYLISGDTKGYIGVWDIQSYCSGRSDHVLAKVWPTTQQLNTPDSDSESSPPQVALWQAHSQAVVSIEFLTREHGNSFILSASSDCTARVWTLEGHYVGMFGQRKLWDLSNTDTFIHPRSPFYEGDAKEDSSKAAQASDLIPPIINVSAPSKRPFTSPEKPSSAQTPLFGDVTEDKASEETTNSARKNSNTSEKSDMSEDPFNWRQSEYYRSMTSLAIERKPRNAVSKEEDESWSILGDKYNKNFSRRMNARQRRRDIQGKIDSSLTTGGGLGKSCSPYQALQIPETKEIQMPGNLPVIRSRAPKGAGTVKSLTWGYLPPLGRSESSLTLPSLDVVSQLSNMSVIQENTI